MLFFTWIHLHHHHLHNICLCCCHGVEKPANHRIPVAVYFLVLARSAFTPNVDRIQVHTDRTRDHLFKWTRVQIKCTERSHWSNKLDFGVKCAWIQVQVPDAKAPLVTIHYTAGLCSFQRKLLSQGFVGGYNSAADWYTCGALVQWF